LGEKLGLDEDEVLSRLENLEKDGLVRRIGPILDIRKLGLTGVLVAVKVSKEEAQGVADVVDRYDEVSHNYLRPNDSGYNMWFTVSAKENRIQEILAEISSETGRKLLVLPTTRIFKIGVKFDIV
jgi:DNA-binding Lrp family transcriptional regulator